MKSLLSVKPKSCSFFCALLLFSLLFSNSGCKKIVAHLPDPAVTTLATGLTGVIGVEADAKGNAWVALPGTGVNDGKVVIVTPDGRQYDAIIHLSSVINALSGEVSGTSHMVLDGDTLFITSGVFLYKANVKGFKPGDAAIDGALVPYEDVGAFSLSYPYVNNAHDSHIYGLCKGPNGDIYMTDAGANSVIHRLSAGHFSVLAEVPGFANPTPMGPPFVQSVPTGIIADGNGVLVTTLTGFPFPTNYATVYKISLSGNVSVYADSLTTLVDIERGNRLGRLAVQYGAFDLASGFLPNSGALVWANGGTPAPWVEGLNLPVGIKQVSPDTWYVTTQGDGSLLKITYRQSYSDADVKY